MAFGPAQIGNKSPDFGQSGDGGVGFDLLFRVVA
jgi:hypothetical protein